MPVECRGRGKSERQKQYQKGSHTIEDTGALGAGILSGTGSGVFSNTSHIKGFEMFFSFLTDWKTRWEKAGRVPLSILTFFDSFDLRARV